jgi:preprotein translocase subunit SecB
MTNGNGTPPEAAQAPQLNVLAQYTKDLSFENPNAPSSLQPQSQPPQINIQINVGANNLSETEFEVTLTVEGKAETAGKVMFSFELAYAGVFRIANVPKENLHPLVMIECPRLLFPFAREIIATAVRDGGFPPLMLDPVDFVGLYRQNMERQMAAQQPAGQAGPGKLLGCRDSWSGQVLVPDRLVAHRCDEGAMGLPLGVRHPWRKRYRPLPPRRIATRVDANLLGFRRQQQLRLPRPHQIDIDFRKQFGVEQRAVLGAM